jgi:hypothetical protein
VPLPRTARPAVDLLPAWLLPPLAVLVFFCSALAAFPFLSLERLTWVLLAALPVGGLWCLLPRDPGWFAAVAAAAWCCVMGDKITGCPTHVLGCVLGVLVAVQGARMVAEPWFLT